MQFLRTQSGNFAGRARTSRLRFSAGAPGRLFRQHPPPPNNSFKPTPCRGVGHVLCATLARVRRPATGRLNSGVRRQKSVWWLCFPMLLFPASVGGALRLGCWHVASSVKPVWRAHTSRALRWPASETLIRVVSFPATDTVASVTSDGEFIGARPGLSASAFGKHVGARCASASTAT
jgi:hypothetical protein